MAALSGARFASATNACVSRCHCIDWGVLALGLLAYVVAAGALVAAATWSAFRSPAAGRFAEVGW